MRKYNIMGHEMAKMEDVNWCIRKARDDINTFGDGKSKEAVKFAKFIVELLIRNLYRDELRDADSNEKKQMIMSLPGDFIVARTVGEKRNRKCIFFSRFGNEAAVISQHGNDAMHFDHKIIAENIAKQLSEDVGGEWYVVDTNPHEAQMNRELLEAIFSPEEE